MGRGKFLGENGRPIVKYRYILRSSVERRLNRQRCRLVCGLGWVQGIVSYMGVQIPRGKGQFLGKGAPIVKYRDTLRSPVPNRSCCSLDYELGLPQGIIKKMGVPIPHENGQFLGKGSPIVKYRHFLL